jgi:thiol:disulfide interchange protein DsbD
MFASAAWLVWVLSYQSGPMGVLTALMGMVLIGFGVWLLTHKPDHGFWRIFVRILAVLSFVAAIVFLPAGDKSQRQITTTEIAFGEAYSAENLAAALETEAPVFVEMTAAWCITCKVNHAVAINIDSTKKLFADKGVRYLIGDWTNQDGEITKFLNQYGRNGVPIYVFYGQPVEGQRPEPVVLPQILTPGTLQNLFN